MRTGSAKPRAVELPVLQTLKPQNIEVRHSRMGRWRAASLIAVTLLMAAHFVQWKLSGRTLSPIEPSEAMYTIQRGTVNAGFIFFALAILSTLVLGRFVCGWGCHIVALQDLCAWLLKKVGIVPRPFRSRLLVFVPVLAAFYMFAWPTVARLLFAADAGRLMPPLSNHLITENFWETFPPFAVAVPFLFVCGFMTVYFLGSKGFCTYACPYGGVFAIADRFAPARIRVTDACEECGQCTAACTSNVIVHAEVKQFGMVVDPGCMKCMDCVSVCPNDALYFGVGKLPPVQRAGAVRKNYSLTWGEEIAAAAVFLLSLLAVWDVYQLVPMLMALGWAAVTTFIAMKTVALIRKDDTSFLRYLLKRSGTLQPAGWAFLAFAVAWTGLSVHSGWVRYHEYYGSEAFRRLSIPDELALAGGNPRNWLNAGDRTAVESGRRNLELARRYGLFTNVEAMPKLAWLEYLSGNSDRAVELLAASAERQQGGPRALSLYYRGAILNRSRDFEKAIISLDEALKERPDLAPAYEEMGESFWQSGRKADAVAAWDHGVALNPKLALGNYMLAGAAAAAGDPSTAEAYEKRADSATPDDPYFHYMIGARLENLGMRAIAEKHFARAIQLDPQLRSRRTLDQLNRL